MNQILQLIQKETLTKEDLTYLIGLAGEEREFFLRETGKKYVETLGNKVYFT